MTEIMKKLKRQTDFQFSFQFTKKHMNKNCMVMHITTDNTITLILKHVIKFVINNERMQGCLAVIPVKSLNSVLHNKQIVFKKKKLLN